MSKSNKCDTICSNYNLYTFLDSSAAENTQILGSFVDHKMQKTNYTLPPSRRVRRHFFADDVDGGPSGVSSVHRHGSEDLYWSQWKFFNPYHPSPNCKHSSDDCLWCEEVLCTINDKTDKHKWVSRWKYLFTNTNTKNNNKSLPYPKLKLKLKGWPYFQFLQPLPKDTIYINQFKRLTGYSKPIPK